MSIAPSPLIWRGLHPSVFLVHRAIRWEEANMFRENNLLKYWSVRALRRQFVILVFQVSYFTVSVKHCHLTWATHVPSFPIYFLSVVSHLFLPCSVAVSHSLYLRTSRDRVLPLFRSSLRINTLPNATITVYYCGFVFRNLLFLITVRTVVILGVFSFFSCFSSPCRKTLIVRYNRFPPFPKFIISQST